MTNVVPLIPGGRRVANIFGVERCPTCGDEGLCVVGTERRSTVAGGTFEAEVVGPCPRCERGHRAEFRAGGGLWGPDGFWRGREIPPELLEAV
jgi:hypothetical protein